ncbi:MAG TPA: hypothetical protein VNS09_05310 [Solirubrobacter sp.]|nr:hypothetical protein [Solirubrobacter sp.]
MAKRSVRRAREQGRPAPAPEPSAGGGARQFWLGALAAACVLIPLAVVAVFLAAQNDAAAPEAVAVTVTPSASEEAAKLQQADDDRNVTQVSELTDQMRAFSDELNAVVTGIDRTLPPGSPDKTGPLASAKEVAGWVATTRRLASSFDETVSGETDTNVARGALATATRGLARTAETYQLALRRPEARRALLASARAQRDDAMNAWDIAAVQVDVINIDAGFGHQHPVRPGGNGTPPDDLPEGTDATGGG